MNKVGIFFGSDTGNTEKVAHMILRYLKKDSTLKNINIYDIANCNKYDIESHKILIFGIPTWYYGEIQCDWDDFLPNLKKINFKNKYVALFGCGDQEDYSEYFCDAIGIIYKILRKKNAIVIGQWPTQDYKFVSSKALLDSTHFCGLTIDEDRQPEKTNMRVKKWVSKILFKIQNLNI